MPSLEATLDPSSDTDIILKATDGCAFKVRVGHGGRRVFNLSMTGGPGPGLLVTVLDVLNEQLHYKYGKESKISYSRGYMIFGTEDGRPIVPPGGDCRRTALTLAHEAVWIFELIVQDEDDKELDCIIVKVSHEHERNFGIVCSGKYRMVCVHGGTDD